MTRQDGNLAFGLAALSLALQLTVSGNLLVAAGIPYDVEGGALAAKIHPATYVAALAMLATLAGWMHPQRRVQERIFRLPELALFVACLLGCIAYAACLTGAGGLIALIDTFLPAGMIAIALDSATPRQLAQLRHVLRSLFFVNALLAIAEAALAARLIPELAGMGDTIADFRPTALYDHPLTGAAATMLGLMLRSVAPTPRLGQRLGPRLWPFCYDAVLFTALLAFGGRTALLVFLLASGGQYGCHLAQSGLRHRLRPRDMLLPAALIVACPLLAVTVLASGMADRLASHLYWDPSAQTRVDQFRILGQLNAEQIIFGCRRTDLLALVEPIRLGFRVVSIENFMLLMLLTLGLLCFPLFLLGFAALLRFLWRRAGAQGQMMILALMAVASTSNSLGRKSILLTLLVGCVAASLREQPRTRHAASGGAARPAWAARA